MDNCTVSGGSCFRGGAEITDKLYLDLNGNTLTGDITGAGTLCGMDSATDKYSTDTMGRITGTVSCAVEQQFKTNVSGLTRRYMAIADDTGYTFRGLVEQIAANASAYTEAQLSALRDMLTRFESTTSQWNVDGIM